MGLAFACRLTRTPESRPMAARSLQSVTITFGLVTIPVKVHVATNPRAGVSFTMLDPKGRAGFGGRPVMTNRSPVGLNDGRMPVIAS